MWPFSTSIWISNPVQIYGNKWYDMSTISNRNAWFQASTAKQARTALFWVIAITRCIITQKSAVLKSKCIRIVASRLGYWLVSYMDTNVVPLSQPSSHRLWQSTASSESKGDTNPVLFVVSNAPVSFTFPVRYVSVAAGGCGVDSWC